MNTIKRLDPSLIENATKKIGKATENDIAQIIGKSGKELERVTPVIFKKAIEKLQKTSFRQLGKLSRKKMSVLRKLNIIKSKFPTKNQGSRMKNRFN